MGFLTRLAWLLVLGTTPGTVIAAEEVFQLHGRILQEDGKPFRSVTPSVVLFGATTPFSTRAAVDPAGKFTIKKLPPGIYTILIAVPRAGELMQSVVIGPAQADSRRRISLTFQVERQPRSLRQRSVSVAELAVPAKAVEAYERAQQRLGKRDVEGAVSFLKRAVELAPHYSAAWNNLGTIAYQSGDFAEAENLFRRSLEADPESYAPLVNLGGALLSQGKVDESLPVNLEAAQARPDDALAHCQLGQNYLALRQLDKAEVHLKIGKALDARHFSFPQLSLADLYLRQKNYGAAVRELEEFLKYHPDSKLAPALREKLPALRALIPH